MYSVFVFVFQVDNTDAEGRLILADALCYGHVFNPRAIVNVATLTGRISLAVCLHGDIKFSLCCKTLIIDKCQNRGVFCLQGAMDVALGSAAAGVFTNSDWLWEQLHRVLQIHVKTRCLSSSALLLTCVCPCL